MTDSPFGDEDPFAGYSVPSFDSVPSIQEPVKVKPSGKNPFIDDPRYETPMVPDQPMQGWRKQFPIGQAKIQIGMSAWVASEHASQENSCPEILAEI